MIKTQIMTWDHCTQAQNEGKMGAMWHILRSATTVKSEQPPIHPAAHQLEVRAFVCLFLELASQPSQPTIPTAKADSGKARYSWIIFGKISPYKLMGHDLGK